MWDKILTDEDGPYIELMVGAYSDNQPDYSWLQPYEVKSFSMYWYPFREIGGVKKANLDAAVNLEVDRRRQAKVGFCTTASHPGATVRLVRPRTGCSWKRPCAIDPGKPYREGSVHLPAGAEPDRPPRLARAPTARTWWLTRRSGSKPEPMPAPDRFPPPLQRDQDERGALSRGPEDRAVPRSLPRSRPVLGRSPEARSGRRSGEHGAGHQEAEAGSVRRGRGPLPQGDRAAHGRLRVAQGRRALLLPGPGTQGPGPTR